MSNDDSLEKLSRALNASREIPGHTTRIQAALENLDPASYRAGNELDLGIVHGPTVLKIFHDTTDLSGTIDLDPTPTSATPPFVLKTSGVLGGIFPASSGVADTMSVTLNGACPRCNEPITLTHKS